MVLNGDVKGESVPARILSLLESLHALIGFEKTVPEDPATVAFTGPSAGILADVVTDVYRKHRTEMENEVEAELVKVRDSLRKMYREYHAALLGEQDVAPTD